MLPPCLFTLHADYIMQNVQPDDSQGGIKITRRNISNLRYADDITLMAGSKEELKSLLMRVKEEREKAGLQLDIQKMKIIVSIPTISWQINGGKLEIVKDLIFLGSKITADGDCSHEIKRCFAPWKKIYDQARHQLKSRDISLPTKVSLVKAMVFPIVLYGYELDHKE